MPFPFQSLGRDSELGKLIPLQESHSRLLLAESTPLRNPHTGLRDAAHSPPAMEKDAPEPEPSRLRNGVVGALYGEFTDMLNDRVRYSVSLTESALTIQKISSSPDRTKVVFNLSDCIGCRAYRGPDSADVGAYFTAYFYPFKRRWMSAGVARQRVEQCFRVALVQDPLANLQEAERWAHAIRDASALQAPRRDGEQTPYVFPRSTLYQEKTTGALKWFYLGGFTCGWKKRGKSERLGADLK